MSEILLLLKLRRRSGVLAAVIAAVHNAGLTFQTQQAREVEGNPGLLLKAEGSIVPAYADLVSHLESVKGIDRVVEIQVDGQPLLPQSPEPEDDSDEGGTGDGPEIEVDVEEFPRVIDEDSEPGPDTFGNLAEQQTVPPSAAPDRRQAPPPVEDQAVNHGASNRDTEPKREMTRAVKRRWRRYR